MDKQNQSVIPFNFGDHLVRVLMDDQGEPWWVGRDVCRVLNHKDVNMAVKNLDDDEKGTRKVWTPGGEQNMIVITESGLYTLIIRSNKPEAKTFRRWITHEVLPSIRRTGSYAMPGADPDGYMGGQDVKKAGNLYFPMAKLVESADKFLEGRAALKALHYFTGMPVDDLLEELEEKQLAHQVRQMADMDSVDFFVREMCELDSTSMVSKDELFDQYQAFCENHGHPPFNRPVFFKRLYRACRNMTLKHLRRRDPGGEKDARTYCVAGIRVVA